MLSNSCSQDGCHRSSHHSSFMAERRGKVPIIYVLWSGKHRFCSNFLKKLYLKAHWPELSHMATPCRKDIWSGEYPALLVLWWEVKRERGVGHLDCNTARTKAKEHCRGRLRANWLATGELTSHKVMLTWKRKYLTHRAARPCIQDPVLTLAVSKASCYGGEGQPESNFLKILCKSGTHKSHLLSSSRGRSPSSRLLSCLLCSRKYCHWFPRADDPLRMLS